MLAEHVAHGLPTVEEISKYLSNTLSHDVSVCGGIRFNALLTKADQVFGSRWPKLVGTLD